MTTTAPRRSGGQPRLIRPPEGLPETWAEVHRAIEEHARLWGDWRSERDRLQTLRAGRDQAAQSDRAAYAQALREGRKDPGTPATDKLARDITASERRIEALREAMDAVTDETIATVKDRREEWQAEADGSVEDARAVYREAIEQLADARHALARARTVARWVRTFPDAGAPTASAGTVKGTERFTGNRDPLSFDRLIEVMRSEADGAI